MTDEQRQKAIDYAEQKYALPSSDNIQIAQCGGGYEQVEINENGAWVLAQVWVPNSEFKGADDDNE